MPKNQKNDRVMDVCAASAVGVPSGGQLLVFLHSSRVVLVGRRYENRSTFFSLVPRSKEKRSVLKILIFDFLKIG